MRDLLHLQCSKRKMEAWLRGIARSREHFSMGRFKAKVKRNNVAVPYTKQRTKKKKKKKKKKRGNKFAGENKKSGWLKEVRETERTLLTPHTT